jgi:outer membrane protein
MHPGAGVRLRRKEGESGDEATMNCGEFAFGGRQTASRSAKAGGALRALLLATVAAMSLGARAGRAETMNGALVKAYVTNPVINSERATVRQTDEGVPAANAGYLPTVSAIGNVGVAHETGNEIVPGQPPVTFSSGAFPRGFGAQAQETIFDGYRTINRIRSAESQVMGARETLRNTEQNTLLTGVTAYMDVLRDTALLELQQNNVLVLKEQLRETRDRFTVGEVTRTDVAQAEASLSSAQATELSAEATLEASIARYRQTIGDEPKMLAPAKPIVRPLPKTLPEAISISQVEHPAITAQLHGVDAALLSVKIAEGALAPTVGLTAAVTKNYDVANIPGMYSIVGEIQGQITIPIYQGGAEYASIRQSKESLSVQELTADSTRDQIRQNVVTAWGLNQAAAGVVRAARAAVAANEVALAGVREEAKVGQRTTLDVLNAQQALLSARSQLVSAEHDAVVDSYSLLSAVGRLNVPTLGLAVSEYDPRVHFNQVKNKWFGVTTPDGK